MIPYLATTLGLVVLVMILASMTNLVSAQADQTNTLSTNQNMSSNATQYQKPGVIIMKVQGGLIGAGSSSAIVYDSVSEEAITIRGWTAGLSGFEGTAFMRHIPDFDEGEANRIIRESGFFEANTYYPPAPNTTDYREYNIVASSDGKLHSVYWTDTSVDVPEKLQRLPFNLGYVLGIGRVP
jgi:hypothetical protein